jgi:hypothetical protein
MTVLVFPYKAYGTDSMCANCCIAQRLHVADKCLYSAMCFEAVRCARCRKVILYFDNTDSKDSIPVDKAQTSRCYGCNTVI